MGLVQRGESFLEPVAPHAVQVDHRADARRVHLVQIVLHPRGR